MSVELRQKYKGRSGFLHGLVFVPITFIGAESEAQQVLIKTVLYNKEFTLPNAELEEIGYELI